MKGKVFKEPLFMAVVNGKITRFTEIIKPQPDFFDNGDHFFKIKPRYKVGETVYLKEPYANASLTEESKKFYPNDDGVIYKWGFSYESMKWKTPLSMPESAARHFIKITGVKYGKLQETSDDDCVKEGIINLDPLFMNRVDGTGYLEAKNAYAALIDSIHGKGTWDSNPWVFRYDFKLLK